MLYLTIKSDIIGAEIVAIKRSCLFKPRFACKYKSKFKQRVTVGAGEHVADFIQDTVQHVTVLFFSLCD